MCFTKIKEAIKNKYYATARAFIIFIVIVVVVNAAISVSDYMSPAPIQKDCHSFKNKVLNLILSILLLFNVFFQLPEYIYKYDVYTHKLNKFDEIIN